MHLSAPIHRLKRQAKLLAREQKIPLHVAQDHISRKEGFRTWSALAARISASSPEVTMLSNLVEGDTLLLAARAGNGKTLMGLELLLNAAREKRRAVFFTLVLTKQEVIELIRSLDEKADEYMPEIVTSGEIGAEFIAAYLSGAPRGTVAVIDFLQILDQQRTKPVLGEQMQALKKFAEQSGIILGFISQIDRSFDPLSGFLPSFENVRLPNPIAINVFSKTCFLHAGETKLQDLAGTSEEAR